MFQLHDTTRRRVCLAAFAALGLAPLVLIGGWCIGQRLPGFVESEAERLGIQLGLQVRLGGLQHLRPGAILYEGFEASDPETGRPIFRCRLLEVAQACEKDAQGHRRAVVALTASQPELKADALEQVWGCLQRLLEGRHGRLESDVRISAGELTLQAAERSQTLTEVSGLMENLPGGTHAQIQFRLAGTSTPEPARIRLVRNRQVSPPASGFELYTGGGELPCSVLAMGCEALRPLGPRCRFRGYIWANEVADGWEGTVTGQLAEVDFGALVSDHFPHKLTGVGEATIQSARFRGGRLEEGSVMVSAGPGVVSRSLIESAVDRLGLQAAATATPSEELIRYEQLAFSATLDADGVQLRGRCTVGGIGTILSDGRNGILSESTGRTTAAALVQALVPLSSVQVPASRQTDWLLRHLPVPEVMPPGGAEAIVPQARVRLRDSMQR